MSFLAPLFLLGGLAIAGPIIFHLVRRATRERTLFSSLMFLLPSPPRLSKRHRIEHIILLILRCLALLLLAFGFARPFLRQAPVVDPTAAQPRRVVVLVDTSASMRRDGAWADARAKVEQVLRRAGAADQVAVFSFDRQANPLVSFDDWNRTEPGGRVAQVLGRLGAVSPTWSGTHLGNALITAAETLAEEDGKEAHGPRQIVLVSDLQAGSRLEALQSYEWPKGVELLVETVKASNPTNAGVQLVADAADTVRAVDAPIRVRVANAPESKRERFTLAWTQPGAAGAPPVELAAPVEAYVPPGQSRVFAMPLPKPAEGENAAATTTTRPTQITLSGDDEPFDNTVFVIPPARQTATVLWLGADTANDPRQPLFFLRRAYSDTPRLSVNVVARAPGEPLPPADLEGAHLIFVSESVAPPTAAALRAAMLEGKTVVLVPRTAAAAPTLGALVGGETVRFEEGRPGNYVMFAEIDFQHPLFAPFADPRFSDFTKIHFWNYRKLDPATVPGARVVAKFDSGDPALVELPIGKGKLFVLAAGWHPEDSQLAVSSKFVPLVWSLLELTGGIGTFSTQYVVGETVSRPSDSAVTGVRTPAGEVVPFADRPIAATLQPGVYEFAGGERPQRFAVNLDANESRTAALETDELEQLGLPIAKPEQATEAEVTENKMFLQGVEAENRQKLWRWFIVATLVLLLIESALAGWTARRSGFQPEEAAS